MSSTPTLPPAWVNEMPVPIADWIDEGEMLIPYVPTIVPPWALRNAPMAVLAGYLGSMLPVSEANMLVLGCSPHSGPSRLLPVTGTPACWANLYPP